MEARAQSGRGGRKLGLLASALGATAVAVLLAVATRGCGGNPSGLPDGAASFAMGGAGAGDDVDAAAAAGGAGTMGAGAGGVGGTGAFGGGGGPGVGAGGVTATGGSGGSPGAGGKAGAGGAAGGGGSSAPASVTGSAAGGTGTGGTSPGPSAPAGGATGSSTPPSGGGHIATVFVVAMENNDSGVYGNRTAFPYLNDELLPRGARANAFTDELPVSMPSEPHYVWMEAGTNVFSDRTFNDDSEPSAVNSTASGAHLVTQLAQAGKGRTWTAYQEDIDATSGACPVVGSGFYRPRHNPFVFFRDVTGDPPSKDAAACAAHHKPLSALASDLASGSVAAYNFITPNLCHDAHGDKGCPSGSPERASDDWMRANLPALLAFADAHQGVLFIVWDEGHSTSRMPFIAAGPHVKRAYASGITYNHGSLLRSVEEIFALPLLPTVASATDFADLFEAGYFP